MYLYHVDVNVNSTKRKKFVPRIPISAGKGENKTIPRICLSDSIDKCIQAIPGLSELTDGNIHKIRVYKYRVNRGNCDRIISPRTLYNRKLVPDALENNEYWCLKPITMDSNIYEVRDIGIEFDLAWTTISIIDVILATNNALKNNTQTINIDNSIKNSYKLYENIINQMTQKHMWEEIDAVWDNLAELPWAQIKRISNINLHKID